MPKRRIADDGHSSRKRRVVERTRRKRQRDDGDENNGNNEHNGDRSKRIKRRNYSDRWYRWRKHLNDTKLEHPELEFWEVLILASETYVRHEI